MQKKAVSMGPSERHPEVSTLEQGKLLGLQNYIQNWVSLRSSGWRRTPNTEQASLNLREIHLPLPNEWWEERQAVPGF